MIVNTPSSSRVVVALCGNNSYAVLATAICLAWLLSTRYRRGLNKTPGPWLRSISSLPRIYSVYRGESHEDDLALHRKYGRVVRIAPNTLSISDPGAINAIYGIGTKFYKSKFYSLSQAFDEEGLIPDTFILTDKELHGRMKKNAANAYSMNGLVQMEPWLEPVTERLFGILDGYAEKKECVDVSKLLQNYAMDAVFALTFGRDFNHLERGDCLGMFKTLHIATLYMAIFGQVAWSHKFLLSNPWLAGLVYDGGSAERQMLELANKEVETASKEDSETGPMTFLQRLLLNQKNNPKSIGNREMMTHAFGNISAGSDTTAIAMRSVLYNVLKHPAVYDRLCREVRENLTLPVGWLQAKDLPYLSAVIREGIRFHPSVGMMLARLVPAGGASICGYDLKAGVEVGVSPWVMHRDPEIFTDPDRFWPERWLPEASSEDQLRLMNRSFLAFGHGAHTCSGRWISTMETQKLIPSLLLKYDMILADGGSGYKFKNHWFTPQSGINVVFYKRTQ